MKFVSFLLGAASSALLTLGFVRAAGACDPHLRHTSISGASSLTVAGGCEQPCQLIQQKTFDRSAQV